jgi:hypothetical protein
MEKHSIFHVTINYSAPQIFFPANNFPAIFLWPYPTTKFNKFSFNCSNDFFSRTHTQKYICQVNIFWIAKRVIRRKRDHENIMRCITIMEYEGIKYLGEQSKLIP